MGDFCQEMGGGVQSSKFKVKSSKLKVAGLTVAAYQKGDNHHKGIQRKRNSKQS